MARIVIIGGGLAGLAAAWQASQGKEAVSLLTKGWGATHWGSGCIDLLGIDPATGKWLESPLAGIGQLGTENPQHPYAVAGIDAIEAALSAFQSLAAESGYPLHGSIERNWALPTALGVARPTCLAPQTMIHGDLRQKSPMLLVGFEHFVDFYPELAAKGLNDAGLPASAVTLSLPALRQRKFVNGVILAKLMETESFQAQLIDAITPHLGDAERVGLPAILGVNQPLATQKTLEAGLNRPIFEIPVLPPSVPGIRLHKLLMESIEREGGQVNAGMEVVEFTSENGSIQTVFSEAAGRPLPHPTDQVVLATGGILGGGIVADSFGDILETIFKLPIENAPAWENWFNNRFLAADSHPIYHAGISVNENFQPLAENNRPIYDNLYCVGGMLADCDPIHERALEGIALVSGFVAGNQAKEIAS